MADVPQPGELPVLDPVRTPATRQNQVLELHAEAITVARRVRKTLVRATRTTRTREQAVEQDFTREQVVVQRVPINQVVDAAPPIREEGDLTIIPVVEEVVVVERRLVLKEEVHLRRVRTTERHTETVTLREQDVAVTRTEINDGDPAGGAEPFNKPTRDRP